MGWPSVQPWSAFKSSAQIVYLSKQKPHGRPSSSSSSSSSLVCESMESSSWRMNREKFVTKVIWPAIRGQSCPICFKDLEARRAAVLTVCAHAYCVECIRKWSDLRRKCPLCNADFNSWFCKISLSSRTFYKEKLPASNNRTRNVDVGIGFSSRRIHNRRWDFSMFPRLFGCLKSVGKIKREENLEN